MLEGCVEKNISVGLLSVPTRKTDHPGCDIKRTQQQKSTEPLVRGIFIDLAFSKYQKAVNQAMHEENE